MENSKSTKKALVASACALLVCGAMFTGATYAWFTDVATASVGKIQSGTLLVELQNENGESIEALNWIMPENSDGIWEPGATYELESFKIVNTGNRALKYTVSIAGTKSGTVDGATLMDAIDFTITGVDGVTTVADLDGFEGKLAGGNGTGMITVTAKMKESAGNQFQGLSIDAIKITVVATQDAVESDGTGNTYDQDATYPVVEAGDLTAAIENATSGSIVQLASNDQYELSTTLPEGVTLAGNGPDSTSVTAKTTGKSRSLLTGYVMNTKNATLSGMTILGETDTINGISNLVNYYGIVTIKEDGSTLDNVRIETSTKASPVVVSAGVDKGETVTISNSTLKSAGRALFIVDSVNGTVNVDKCDLTGVYALNVNSGDSPDLVVNVTDSKLHGWTSYSTIKAVNFTNTEFSKGESAYDFLRFYADTTFTGCTFDSEFTMDAGASGKTLTVNNCSKNGVKITADNIQELLFSMNDNLRACTIVVDGVQVTLN